MATKTIESGKNTTKVGAQGVEITTSTRTTYTLDETGKINPNSVKHEIIYYEGKIGDGVIAATRTGTSGDWKNNNKPFSNTPWLGADAQKSLKEGALKTTTQQQINTASKKEGLTPEQTKAVSGSSNAATSTETGSQQGALDQNQLDFINEDLKSIKSRPEYNKKEPIIYPIGLKSEYQDCIKFSIVKYNPSGLKGFGQGNRDLRRVNISNGIPSPKGREKEIIGTIVLPIPGGISDSNRVGWSDSKLNDLDQALGKLFTTGVTGGDIGAEFKRQTTAAAKEGSGARTGIIGKVAEGVIGAEGGFMQRQFGAIINPNLELLFNSPDLRQFSFSFRLSPRSGPEAERVRKIIRAFKQSMSVKRSNSSFLLQTPHTFAISYIFKKENHPYLNKFKECALTSCNVNYTPEGTYMSFDDSNNPSMVSYQLDLTFQELEPIYDDDYTDLDENKDTKIGY